jgi:hypothetical protein
MVAKRENKNITYRKLLFIKLLITDLKKKINGAIFHTIELLNFFESLALHT